VSIEDSNTWLIISDIAFFDWLVYIVAIEQELQPAHFVFRFAFS
jgi:hypothetical protein